MLSITVELRRYLERSGKLHPPGARLTLPQSEAIAMIEAGWAAPLGAPADFGLPPARNWVKTWRT